MCYVLPILFMTSQFLCRYRCSDAAAAAMRRLTHLLLGVVASRLRRRRARGLDVSIVQGVLRGQSLRFTIALL